MPPFSSRRQLLRRAQRRPAPTKPRALLHRADRARPGGGAEQLVPSSAAEATKRQPLQQCPSPGVWCAGAVVHSPEQPPRAGQPGFLGGLGGHDHWRASCAARAAARASVPCQSVWVGGGGQGAAGAAGNGRQAGLPPLPARVTRTGAYGKKMPPLHAGALQRSAASAHCRRQTPGTHCSTVGPAWPCSRRSLQSHPVTGPVLPPHTRRRPARGWRACNQP